MVVVPFSMVPTNPPFDAPLPVMAVLDEHLKREAPLVVISPIRPPAEELPAVMLPEVEQLVIEPP